MLLGAIVVKLYFRDSGGVTWHEFMGVESILDDEPSTSKMLTWHSMMGELLPLVDYGVFIRLIGLWSMLKSLIWNTTGCLILFYSTMLFLCDLLIRLSPTGYSISGPGWSLHSFSKCGKFSKLRSKLLFGTWSRMRKLSSVANLLFMASYYFQATDSIA
jgi:hypothetical protein